MMNVVRKQVFSANGQCDKNVRDMRKKLLKKMSKRSTMDTNSDNTESQLHGGKKEDER